MDRRTFIKHTSLAGIGTALLPAGVLGMAQQSFRLSNPVTIQSVQLLLWGKERLVVVTDTEGNRGITLCNSRMEHLAGIFNGLVAPFFVGKDARQVAELAEAVYKDERNYKYSGMPFWNCVGHVEVALWDLLGKRAGKPVHQLLGKAQRSQLPMYLSSLTRNNTAAEETDKLLTALATTGCQAVKIKVGGRMGTDAKAEQRSYDLVKLLRSKGPTDLTIYADANGSFDVAGGIRMGRFLEDQGVDIYEEPCPWEDFESNQRVTAALKKIKVAGGEQDTSYHRFEWYCRHGGLDVLQPDTFYNGGISRSLKVAQLCQRHRKHFAPHSPKADPLEAPFLHLMAVAPAVYGYQEFPLSGVGNPAGGGASRADNWWGPHFLLQNGQLSVPQGPGLGIEYDASIWQTAQKI
jgi:D-galactarolactone cycloisomerase